MIVFRAVIITLVALLLACTHKPIDGHEAARLDSIEIQGRDEAINSCLRGDCK